jgi:Zn-dependent protease with chaperone function
MTDELPTEAIPFTNISPRAYEHPADRAATAALQSVPMLETLVRRLVEWGYEKAMRQSLISSGIRVSEQQLPELWSSHRTAVRVLDLPQTPPLYVTAWIDGQAVALGAQKPMIVVSSQLLRNLGPAEQRALLGHELSHVLAGHVVYTTALNILLAAGTSLPSILGLPFQALRTVLMEWYRAAELSCDRAAALVVHDPRVVCRLLMVASSWLPADQLNPDAFIAQALEYENWSDPSDRVMRFFRELGVTHPLTVRRVSELMRWVQSGEYDRILRGEYVTRDQQADVRAEAGEAFEHYSQRFRAAFQDLGHDVRNVSGQVGDIARQASDVARQASEWLQRRGDGEDESGE